MDVQSKRLRLVNLVFVGTILLGMGLPLFAMLGVDTILNHTNLSTAMHSVITFFFDELTGMGFLFWLFHSILFLLLAFLIRSRLLDKANAESGYVIRLSQAIGSWTLTVGFSLSMNIGILISDSSTAVLGFIFVPFYGLVFMIIGYNGGWVVGKLILYAKGRQKS